MLHCVSRSTALCSDIATLKCRRFTHFNRDLHLILIAAFKQRLTVLVKRCLNVKNFCSISALLVTLGWFLKRLKSTALATLKHCNQKSDLMKRCSSAELFVREITYTNNCVFHCVHKKIDNAFSPGANYLFHESGLQITLSLLSSSLGNTVLLHTLFLEYKTQIGEKKILDNVFQSNCSSRAYLLTNLRKIKKQPKIRHRLVMHSVLQLVLLGLLIG